MTFETLKSDPKHKERKMKKAEETKVETKTKKRSPIGNAMASIGNKIVEHWNDARVIAKNTAALVEATALLIVTGFAIYGSLHYEMRNEYKYSVLFSGIVVGLIAMNLLRKFLARR